MAAPSSAEGCGRIMNNNDFAYERPPSPANVNMTAEASGFSSVYQAGGDQVIYEQSPPFYLTQVPLSAPTVEPGRIVLQPSRMLRTKFEIVPFIGRDTEISQLKKWRDTDISRVAVCLIHGPGGQGKTRLAVQLARMWAEEGWTALQALSPNDFRDLDPFEILPEDETEGQLYWSTTPIDGNLRICLRCYEKWYVQQTFPYGLLCCPVRQGHGGRLFHTRLKEVWTSPLTKCIYHLLHTLQRTDLGYLSRLEIYLVHVSASKIRPTSDPLEASIKMVTTIKYSLSTWPLWPR